eukprot:372306_1
MLTVLQPESHEGSNIDTKTPSLTTLLEQIADLTVKYESLEQNYNTITLENKEYKNHINELTEQNEDLKRELECNIKQIDEEKALTPILTQQLTSMSNFLHKNDTEMKQLQTKLYSCNTSIETLNSENVNVKNQNEKFRQILESNIKQKQIHDETLMANQKYINNLETELQRLKDELQTIKSISCLDLKNTNSNSNDMKFTMPSECENDSIQTLCFMKTMDDTQGTKLSLSLAESNDTENMSNDNSIQFIDIDAEKQFGGMNSVYEQDIENNNNNELIIEIQRLKIENIQLRKQLEENNNQVILDKEETKYDVESDSELTENEMADMESLFEKCNVEIEAEWEKQNKSVFMNKFVKVSVFAGAYR